MYPGVSAYMTAKLAKRSPITLKVTWCAGLLNLLFPVANACEFRVQVSDFPPYSYQVNGQWQGSRVVLSQRLADKLNCDVKYLDVPWARALLLLRSGDLDMMFNMTPTAERNQFIWFTKPHHLEKLGFAVTLKDDYWRAVKQVGTLRNFPGMIALTQGSFMGPDMSLLLKDPNFRRKVIEVAERRTKNELVLRGRAQGLVEDTDYLHYAIANFPDYQGLFVTPLVLSSTPVFLGISKQSPLMALKREIDKALDELDKAGLWFSHGT